MALINTIYEAIGDRRVLAFTYKGKERTAEPYIVGYDDHGKLVLSAVQLTGGSGNGFRSFDVDELSSVAKTERTVLRHAIPTTTRTIRTSRTS